MAPQEEAEAQNEQGFAVDHGRSWKIGGAKHTFDDAILSEARPVRPLDAEQTASHPL